MNGKQPGWMNDYIDVETRIAAFYERHPQGSIQVEVELFDPETGTAVMRARAYRFPEDEKPATGVAMEARDHQPREIMQEGYVEAAGTHAIGKALEAAGFAKKRGNGSTGGPRPSALRNRILDALVKFEDANQEQAFIEIAGQDPEQIPANKLAEVLNALLKKAKELKL